MQLFDLAQHGTASYADARSLGLDPSDLRRMSARGEVLRLVRGWYAVRPPTADTPPWEGADRFDTARRRHLLRTVALVRSFEGRVVASHQSALVLHGVDLWRADLDIVHLTRTTDDHSRHRRGAVIHPATQLGVHETPAGLPTVPVAVAVVQVGLQPGRSGVPAFAFESLVAADSALRAGLTDPRAIAAAVAAHRGHPGIRAVSLLLKDADGRHESVGETRVAHALRALGYRFTPQVEYVVDGLVFRSDFELDDAPVIIEFDGLAKYGAGVASASPATLRAALAAEKRREDALRSRGKQFVRLTWPDLDSLPLIQRRIEAAIARSRIGRSA